MEIYKHYINGDWVNPNSGESFDSTNPYTGEVWAKIARGLSAGRGQSVAVRLLVEREREVRIFVPEEYWEVYADTECECQKLRLHVVKENVRKGKTA